MYDKKHAHTQTSTYDIQDGIRNGHQGMSVETCLRSTIPMHRAYIITLQRLN